MPIEIDEPFYLATGGKDHVSAAAALGSGSIEPLSIPYSVIRVLVLHTPAALADVGSQDQLNALVAESFAQTNQAILNSQIVNYRLENVATGANLSTQINYGETNLNVCAPALTPAECRYIGHRNWLRRSATAQALRNSTNADMVVMFVADDEAATGVAYVQHPDCGIEPDYGENSPECGMGTAFSDFAYSVVSTQFATSYQVFAHENGHQLGMEHDQPSASPVPSFPWSYARVTSAAQSLLGTSLTLPVRSLQYSNPSVNFIGTTVPSGTAQAWNARTGAALAGYVGEFRDPQYLDLVFGAGFEGLPLE